MKVAVSEDPTSERQKGYIKLHRNTGTIKRSLNEEEEKNKCGKRCLKGEDAESKRSKKQKPLQRKNRNLLY